MPPSDWAPSTSDASAAPPSSRSAFASMVGDASVSSSSLPSLADGLGSLLWVWDWVGVAPASSPPLSSAAPPIIATPLPMTTPATAAAARVADRGRAGQQALGVRPAAAAAAGPRLRGVGGGGAAGQRLGGRVVRVGPAVRALLRGCLRGGCLLAVLPGAARPYPVDR